MTVQHTLRSTSLTHGARNARAWIAAAALLASTATVQAQTTVTDGDALRAELRQHYPSLAWVERVRRAYRPRRNAPPVSTNSIVLLGVFYLISALPTLRLGIAVYTPCVSNFEGGCSMGKGIAAVITLLTSSAASGLGIVLMTQLTAHPTIAGNMRGAIRLTHLLWLAPLAYFLFTLHVLF